VFLASDFTSLPEGSRTITQFMYRPDSAATTPLADDLRRFLDSETVSAKPPTLLRRSKAWSRRHRVASAAIVGLLILVSLIPFTTHYFFGRATDSPAKGPDMNVSKTAKVVACVLYIAMMAGKPFGLEVPDPTGLVVSAATEDSISLEWRSSGGTTVGFIVAYLEGTTYPKSKLRAATIIDVGNQEYCTVSGLKTDQVYSFRVCAYDRRHKRSGGVTVQGTTLSAPPELYEVFDQYAEFVDEFTMLGTYSTHAQQTDGRVLIGAIANDVENPGSHFIARMNADGTADNTFGTNGYHRMDVLNDGDSSFDYTKSVIALPNGRILAAGSTGGTIVWQTTAWYLIQYDEFGLLDPAFGEGGVVIDTVPGVQTAKAFSIEVRPNGKIVGAASVLREGPYNYKWTVVQYNADGSRDMTFGSEGGLTSFLPQGAKHCDVSEMAILRNGKIAVVGQCHMLDERFLSAVVMFNEDGTVDSDFGNGGYAYVDTWPETGYYRIGWERFTDLVEQPDGKLLAVGDRAGISDTGEYEYSHVRTMARFQVNGAVDTSFGIDGMVIPSKFPNGDYEQFDGVALQSDQKIVVMGYSHSLDAQASDSDLFIERYNVDGSRDMSFNGTGRIPFSTLGAEMAHGLQIDEYGTIIIAGTHSSLEPEGLSRGLLLYLVPMP